MMNIPNKSKPPEKTLEQLEEEAMGMFSAPQRIVKKYRKKSSPQDPKE